MLKERVSNTTKKKIYMYKQVKKKENEIKWKE